VNNSPSLKLGLIGCGNFGQFCLEAYSQLDEIEIVAVGDVVPDLAKETADQYGVRWYTNPLSLIQDPDVELIHLATPPDTHGSLGLEAVRKGKHVLCEKPLALSLNEAKEILSVANEKNCIFPVDFVLRYVPTVDVVKKIIQSKILGEPIHAYFENYATDEPLHQDHWFWKEEKSGGIFVEHGVHFFDLYQYWFGEAEVKWAYAQKRHNTKQIDRVFCFLTHTSGVLSNHYHGFDQPSYLDRQRHTILFETGDVTVEGWIPIVLTVNGLVDEEKIFHLKEICPDGDITILGELPEHKQSMIGRGKSITVTKNIQLRYQVPRKKMEVYAQAVRNLLTDQIQYIRDRKHQRVVTEKNGLIALKLALNATHLTKQTSLD
jgi:predicted dehydrogenase